MSLKITNTETGETQTIDSGKVADLTFTASTFGLTNSGAARFILVESTIKVDVSYLVLGVPVENTPVVAGFIVGEMNALAAAIRTIYESGEPPDKFWPSILISVQIPATPGTYYVSGVLYENGPAESFGIRCRVLPVFGLKTCDPLAWIPAGLIDLLADLDLRTVKSAILSRASGVKQGDTLPFAVVPSQAGAAISAGITALSLVVLPAPGSDYSPLIFAGVATPVDVAGDKYYPISVPLTGSVLQSWFDDANDKALAIAKATNTDPVPVSRLDVFAELHITLSGVLITSESFPFPILQALQKP